MFSDEVIKEALKEIDLEIDDVVINDEFIRCGRSEWIIASDELASKKVKDFIKDSLWAFKTSFLSSMTGHDEEEIKLFASEFENDTLIKIVEYSCGLENFVNEAIKADGRGHFLSTYDGVEVELKTDDGVYYLYRLN